MYIFEDLKSTELARKLNYKHSELVKIIKPLMSELEIVGYGGAEIKPIDDIYRGNEFTSYMLNKTALIVMLSRVKSVPALSSVIETLSADMSSDDLLINDILASHNKLEIEVSDLRAYKDAFIISQSLKAKVSDGRKKQKTPELIMHKGVIDCFSEIFPSYTYVGSEVELEDGDKADIIALDRETGHNVVIELKCGPISAHKQLRSYACNFDNCVMVNLTKTIVPMDRRVEGIVYRSLDSIDDIELVKSDLNRFL